MTNELIIKQLTGIQTGTTNYSITANAFLGNGFTSSAGNHYFNAIRFADGIVIIEDIGEGWAHTFLNGIKIYSLRDKKLLVDECFHNVRYSKELVKSKAKQLLLDQLIKAASLNNFSFNIAEAERIISGLISQAFINDQREMVNRTLHKQLR